MASLKKNVGAQNFTFCLVLASSGAAFTVTSTTNISGFVTKDGGVQASVAGTITSLSNGQYNYAPTTAETNANDVGFMYTVTGGIPVNLDFHTDLVDSNGNINVDVAFINGVATTSVTTINANVGQTQPVNFTGTGGTALIQVDTRDWLGTVVSTPATAGIPDINVKNMNNVAATSITTINANQGTTQPVNFTGTGASALVKGDTIDWNSTAVSAPATAGIPDVNIKNVNNVSASSVTAVNANVGSAQPINSTGSGGTALVQSDVKDWNSNAISGNLPSNFASLSIDSGGNVATTSNIKKNVASSGFMFTMTFVSNSAPAPGLTVTPTRAIDGGSFGSTTNSVTEIANGWYTLNLSAADVNGNHIALRFAATGANDTDIELVTQP